MWQCRNVFGSCRVSGPKAAASRSPRIRQAPILRTSSYAQLHVSLSRILRFSISIVSTPELRCIFVSPTLAGLLCDAAQQRTQRTPQPAESVSDRPENFASGDSAVVGALRIIRRPHGCMKRPHSGYPLPCSFLAGSDRR